uniref:Similar to n=1 Tax=Panagrellus redivivus TaxID=6233 RepID=A0A7E4VUR5_PANRE
MADSPSPFSITYTEDDLRAAAARISQAQASAYAPPPPSTPPPDPVNKLELTSTSLTKPSHPPVVVSKPRVSREERRRQVSEILTQQEREFAARNLERSNVPQPANLTYPLPNKPSSAPLRISRGISPFPQAPRRQSSMTEPLQSLLIGKQKYERYSDKSYYDWDDLKSTGINPPLIHDSTQAHRESCELCRLGLDFERKERERLAAKAARPRLPSRSEYCDTVKRFADEYHDTFM